MLINQISPAGLKVNYNKSFEAGRHHFVVSNQCDSVAFTGVMSGVSRKTKMAAIFTALLSVLGLTTAASKANANTSPVSEKPVTAVIDNFKMEQHSNGDFDGDHKIDFTPHGSMVEIAAGGPEHVLRLPSPPGGSVKDDLDILEKVLASVNKDNTYNIRAVNISKSLFFSFELLSTLVNEQINASNIDEKYLQVVEGFKSLVNRDEECKKQGIISDGKLPDLPDEQGIKTIKNILRMYDLIDRLSKSGIPVTVGAGNTIKGTQPTEQFNLLTLNPKVASIGYSVDGNRDGSFQNDLVDVYIDRVIKPEELAEGLPPFELLGLSRFTTILDEAGINSIDAGTIKKLAKKLVQQDFHIEGSSFTSAEMSKVVKHLAVNKGMSVEKINTEVRTASQEATQKGVDILTYMKDKWGLKD